MAAPIVEEDIGPAPLGSESSEAEPLEQGTFEEKAPDGDNGRVPLWRAKEPQEDEKTQEGQKALKTGGQKAGEQKEGGQKEGGPEAGGQEESGQAAGGAEGAASGTELTPKTVNVPGGPALSFVYDRSPHRYMLRADGQTILVLSGRIRNDFDHPVSRIKLRGTLLNAEKAVLNERRAPAGNLISEYSLRTLPMPEILSRLQPPDGADGINLGIKPGAEVPFMLVFDNIPPDLFEYVIDPVGWEPAQEP
jgi:hypothetical protein